MNGESAAIVSASDRRLKFVCPQLRAGTAIGITVETTSGSSNAVASVVHSATPRILTAEDLETNQGLIFLAGSSELAMERNYRIPAHPAQAGDQITIWATGLGADPPPPSAVSVKVGGRYAYVESVQLASGIAGVYTIQVRLPDAAASGSGIPVQLEVATPEGGWLGSNEATLAIEPVSQ